MDDQRGGGENIRRRHRQRGEVSLIGCLAVKARVGPPTVVKSEVLADRSAGLADAAVAPQIHLLVFDAAPQPLDEDVVAPGAPLPSMLIAIPFLISTSVNAAPVNWRP